MVLPFVTATGKQLVAHHGPSSEFLFLCLLARPRQTAVDAAQLTAAAGGVRDWALVEKAARHHHIIPRMMAVLSDEAKAVLPEDILRRFEARRWQLAKASLRQAGEVIRLSRLFEAAGLDMLVLKGVVLSQQLYGDITLRGAGDIDLLVAPRQFMVAHALLEEQGYVPTMAPHAGMRDLILRHPGMGHLIELHQRFSLNPGRLDIPFERLWQKRQMVGIGGHRVAALPREVEASYLAIHGSGHCWSRLSWLVDIAEFLLVPGGAERLMEEARGFALERAMAVPLLLAQDWLGVPLPPILVIEGAHSRTKDLLVKRFFAGERWQEGVLESKKQPLRRRFLLRIFLYSLKQGWRHRLAELAADLNNPVDRAAFALPPGFGWLYPVLRPLGRLFWRSRISGTRR